MTIKHTPGPWRFEHLGGELYIVAGHDPALRVVEVSGILGDGKPEPFHVERAKANARLIAAAPNILKAARAILPLLFYHGQKGCDAGCEGCAAIDALESALGDAG